jgi:ATP-binding cassette, subfamily F, member 3
VAALSGGERRRLALLRTVVSGANFLVLDEPTNHLDLESREALEDALRAFDGALLLVSHDRALLDAVGTRTIAIEEGRLHSYPGGWADYVRVRDERRAAAGLSTRAASGRPGGRRRAGQVARPAVSNNAKRRAEALERAVEDAEAALAGVEDELSDPDCWTTPERAAESTARHEEAKRRVELLYEELLTLSD